jgi:uncharacterized membrane protein
LLCTVASTPSLQTGSVPSSPTTPDAQGRNWITRLELSELNRGDSVAVARSVTQETEMANEDGLFLYIGTYPGEADARADYDIVKDLHSVDVIGTYDAAVVTKDEDGKVHVNKDETATRHAGWGGAAAGAVVGLLFPPAIIGSALVGGAIGGISGHLWRGISRSDVKDLGELIDEGEAALVVVGATTLQEALDKAGLKPAKHVTKQVDVSTSDVDAAVKDAAGSLG